MKPGTRQRSAFTLLEIMIAVVILGAAMLAIMDGLSSCFNAVESIRNTNTATELLSLKLAELQQESDLEEGGKDGDFEDTHPGFKWSTEIEPSPDLTDLYEVKITVAWTERGQSASESVETYLYRALSGPKNFSQATKKLGAPQVKPHR